MKGSTQITSPYAPDIAQVRGWLERMIVALRFVEIVTAILALIARMRDVNTELTKQLVQPPGAPSFRDTRPARAPARPAADGHPRARCCEGER